MGLFDKILGGGSNAPFSKPEAFAAIMLAVIAADGDISDEEKDDFLARVNRMKLFRDIARGEFSDIIDKLFKILRKDGPAALATRGAAALPADLKPTVFAVATDMIFADGNVEESESALVEKLQTDLGIADDLAGRIVEVISLKNRG